MTELSANIFATKEYELLAWLWERQTDTSLGPVVMYSQNDLVRERHGSPVTINKRMKALCESGCLEPFRKRGNYRITEKGRAVIGMMNEIETLIGGTDHDK